MVNGDFEIALFNMINHLSETADGQSENRDFAQEILSSWDKKRGNDWYTSTIRREESQCKVDK